MYVLSLVAREAVTFKLTNLHRIINNCAPHTTFSNIHVHIHCTYVQYYCDVCCNENEYAYMYMHLQDKPLIHGPQLYAIDKQTLSYLTMPYKSSTNRPYITVPKDPTISTNRPYHTLPYLPHLTKQYQYIGPTIPYNSNLYQYIGSTIHVPYKSSTNKPYHTLPYLTKLKEIQPLDAQPWEWWHRWLKLS